MVDKLPYFAAETGTYSTSAPNPHIDLDGTAVDFGAKIPTRTFASAASDSNVDFSSSDTCQVTISQQTDNSNFAEYSGVVWTDASPDTLDLSSATLEASGGTLSNSDNVHVWAVMPEKIVIAGFMEQSSQSPTTSDITGAVNTHYILNLSGLTADRNLTLPTATAGDKIRVTVTTGDADYELILKGAATVTINGGSAATEWSRVFIDNESVLFEATSSTNWQVVHDGRIMSSGTMTLSADITTNTATIEKQITFDTEAQNTGDWIDNSVNYGFVARRDGRVIVSLAVRPYTSIADQTYYTAYIKVAGTQLSAPTVGASGTNTWTSAQTVSRVVDVLTGNAITAYFQAQQTDKGVENAAHHTYFSFREI